MLSPSALLRAHALSVCPPTPRGVSRSVPKKKLSKPPLLSVIQDLLAWRTAQGLSQSQAVAALNQAGVPVTLDSLQNWEIGRRKPNGETALALHAFLSQGSPPSAPARGK